MSLNRRSLLGGAAAAAGLSLFSKSAVAAIEGGKPYGVISIAVTGITTSVYRIDRHQLRGKDRLSGYEQLGLRRIDNSASLVASPLQPGADEAAIANAVELVAGDIAKLKSNYAMDDSEIAIVGSSGLRSYAGPIVEQLPAQLRARTGLGMRLLSTREEARLETDWIVPSAERDAVLHIEIAGADVKGGYYHREGGRAAYHDLSLPFGTRNFAGAVKFRYPSVRTDDFGARAADHYQEVVAPVLKAQLAAVPEAVTRPKVYLTGGIVWAMAMIVHPQEMALQKDFTHLSPDDFTTLRKLVETGTPYGAGLPDSLIGAQRDWVHKNLGFIRNIFNPHQLAAGAALGAGLGEQLAFASRQEIAFPSFANGASSSQYLLYQITGNRDFKPR